MTDEFEIIQLLPAPANMWMRHRLDDGYIYHFRVVCLALVTDRQFGNQGIMFCETDSLGQIDLVAPGMGSFVVYSDTCPDGEGGDRND